MRLDLAVVTNGEHKFCRPLQLHKKVCVHSATYEDSMSFRSATASRRSAEDSRHEDAEAPHSTLLWL